jgi:hypothetical protein
MNLIFLFILVLYCILSFPAHAEYRLYQFYVHPQLKSPLVEEKKSSIEISTLDPVTYVAYHGGQEAIKVDLLRTWICPGDTSKQIDFCPSPYEEFLNKSLQDATGPGQKKEDVKGKGNGKGNYKEKGEETKQQNLNP